MPLRSLRSLTLLFLGLFFAVMALAGFALFSATQATMHRLADQRIASISTSLAPGGVAVDRAELVRRMDELSGRRDTGDLGIVLSDATGHEIAGNVLLVRPLPLGYSSMNEDDQIPGLTHGRALVRDIGAGQRLAVFVETEPFDNYFAARARIYLAAFSAIILVVLGGLVLFRRLVGQRIVAMRRTVDAIIDGDLARRVPVVGTGDEFDQQAEGFNRMLDRIGELMTEIRHMSSDIAHELRTPLARLRNQLLLIERDAPGEALRAELAAARDQADQLLAMFAAILRIAEVEGGHRRANFAPLRLDMLAREAVETLEPVAEESGHRLTLEGAPPTTMIGDRQLLTQLLVNLIENALRHTPPGTRIALKVVASETSICLCVIDNGPGIPAPGRAQATRRFGRLEASRTSPGHGLGLPLVDAIARLHGGTLRLDDARPGLNVTIVFPRTAQTG